MTINIKKLKKALFYCDYDSLTDIQKILKSINLSIDDILITVTEKESIEASSWTEAALIEDYDLTISKKTLNHLLNITDFSLISISSFFENIKNLDKKNVQKLKDFIKTCEHKEAVFRQILKNEDTLGEEFIFYVIEDLAKNKKLGNAIRGSSLIESKYLLKISPLLSINEHLTLSLNIQTPQSFDLLKVLCDQKKTTIAKFLLTEAKTKVSTPYFFSLNSWKKVINRASIQELQEFKILFETTKKMQKNPFYSIDNAVLKYHSNRVIEMEKKKLTKDLKSTPIKNQKVLKL